MEHSTIEQPARKQGRSKTWSASEETRQVESL